MATCFHPGTPLGHSSTVNGVAGAVDSTVALMYDPVTAISVKRWGGYRLHILKLAGRTAWGRHGSVYGFNPLVREGGGGGVTSLSTCGNETLI